jgi:uncharacterized protein
MSTTTQLEELGRLYADLDSDILRFRTVNGFDCVRGCGTCCRNFEPDITEIESDFLAAHIIRYQPELIERLENPRPARITCVLYREEGEFHCPAYGGRPLICRLFGFTSVFDKNGLPHFSLCNKMPSSGDRYFDSAGLTNRFSEQPPVMQNYSAQMTGINGGFQASLPLRESLPGSLDKIRFRLKCAEEAGTSRA